MQRNPKSINVTTKEKPQALDYDIMYKMKLIICTIELKIPLLNEMLSKVEPAVLGDKKILNFNTAEYEALCEMLNSLKLLSAQGKQILLGSDYYEK